MSRKNDEYTHVITVKSEILEMVGKGKTQREIAEQFGFRDKEVVKQFLKRERRKEKQKEAGIVPQRRGRPPKGYKASAAEKDNEIKRLRMENELLRDFLHAAGRR